MDADVLIWPRSWAGRTELLGDYRQHGAAVLGGVFAPEELLRLREKCAALLDREALQDPPAGHPRLGEDAPRRNHVVHLTHKLPEVADVLFDPRIVAVVRDLLGECWPLTGGLFGVVYQDADNDEGSSYRRIGWHTDWQSGPQKDRWPALTVTIHLDPTGPDNGHLRVLAGSHMWATPESRATQRASGSLRRGGYGQMPPPHEMPLAHEPLLGEQALPCAFGDVLFHDAYLWHAASEARPQAGLHRRHLRVGWYSGPEDQALDTRGFTRNAAR